MKAIEMKKIEAGGGSYGTPTGDVCATNDTQHGIQTSETKPIPPPGYEAARNYESIPLGHPSPPTEESEQPLTYNPDKLASEKKKKKSLLQKIFCSGMDMRYRLLCALLVGSILFTWFSWGKYERTSEAFRFVDVHCVVDSVEIINNHTSCHCGKGCRGTFPCLDIRVRIMNETLLTTGSTEDTPPTLKMDENMTRRKVSNIC